MASHQLMTVRGAVACDDSSVQWVLPHEHLFHSIYAQLPISSTDGVRRSSLLDGTTEHHDTTDIRPDQLHELRVDPTSFNGRNLLMQREDEIFREVETLVQMTSGSGVVIDVTTAKEGRDLAKLQRLAARVGVHIIASTSYEEQALLDLPTFVSAQEKSERVAKAMETELMFGVGESQSEGCAGIIYQQVHLRAQTFQPETNAILTKALALAQKNTGVPLFFSFSHDKSVISSEQALNATVTEWMTNLVAHGASPDRVVLCHADLWSESAAGVQFLVELAQRGVVLSFDMVGLYTVSDVVRINQCEAPLDGSDIESPRDSAVARCVATLIHDHGLSDSVLVSSGVRQRIQLLRHGGGGYAYALHHFKRRLMERHAVSPIQWQQISCKTPLRLLCWYTPPAAAVIPKHFLKCTICAEYFEPIVGEYFTKFQFVYCGTKCLRKHSKLGFKPLE